MLNKINQLIKQYFYSDNYGNNLKKFIAKHSPKTPADIEYLERQWLYKQNGGSWLWNYYVNFGIF